MPPYAAPANLVFRVNARKSENHRPRPSDGGWLIGWWFWSPDIVSYCVTKKNVTLGHFFEWLSLIFSIGKPIVMACPVLGFHSLETKEVNDLGISELSDISSRNQERQAQDSASFGPFRDEDVLTVPRLTTSKPDILDPRTLPHHVWGRQWVPAGHLSTANPPPECQLSIFFRPTDSYFTPPEVSGRPQIRCLFADSEMRMYSLCPA